MKTIDHNKKAMIMKNIKFVFILFVVCTMALSSCSRGYGCYYSSTEMKEIKPAVELQQNDIPEVEENAILSRELTGMAD